MTRQILSSSRRAETFTLQFGNQTVTITTGFHADGELGDVFINSAKSGTDLACVVRDAGELLSLALHHGVDVATMAHAITRDSLGAAASILGAIVDAIADGDGRGDDHERA